MTPTQAIEEFLGVENLFISWLSSQKNEPHIISVI